MIRKVRNHFSSLNLFISLLLFCPLLVSCVTEDMGECPDDIPGSKIPVPEYYITINVINDTGSHTRAFTDNDKPGNSSSGELEGTSEETRIEDITLFLCVNNKVKHSFSAEYIDPLNGSNSTSARIRIPNINDLSDLAGEDVQFFLAANTSTFGFNLSENPEADETDDVAEAVFNMTSFSTPIGDFGNDGKGKLMPLVSSEMVTINVPADLSASPDELIAAIKAMFVRDSGTIKWWDVLNEDEEPIHLERAVARIEYRDIDRTSDASLPKEKHVYKIESSPAVNLKLSSMQMYNVSSKSYMFKHTSAGDYNKAVEDLDLLQVEKGSIEDKYNWVATPDWDFSGSEPSKSTGNFLNSIDFNSGFAVDASNSGTYNSYITIEDLEKRSTSSETGFRPWCYVSENTIPSIELMQSFDSNGDHLVAKYATGVLFTFTILGQDGKTPLIYNENENGYPAGVTNSPNKPYAIEIVDKQGKWIEVERTGTNYYIKYMACILHNKIMNGDKYAPMYYGVVRNNTYQMYVNSISKLPDPNEPKSLYLNLSVNIKEWQQRENGYDF